VARHATGLLKLVLPALFQKTPSTIAPTKAKATYAATKLNLSKVMEVLPWDECAAHIMP
jgi:hypothetical protein